MTRVGCVLETDSPLISVLIPGYNDLDGVRRILDKIPVCEVNKGTIEVLLSDDSPDFMIGKVILASDAYTHVTVFSGPKRGGVANWNALLRKSNGRFVQFVHHDESPESLMFFTNLLSLCSQSPRILFHSCVLRRKKRDLVHCRSFLLKLSRKYVPEYYLRRNIFGSPSNFCVPRSELQFFNESLIFYVDVDWYSRFSKDLPWESTGLTMLSFDNPDSITSDLRKKGLTKVKRQEALSLKERFQGFHSY